MATTDVEQALADPELERTEWNLDPLVDGRGEQGVDDQLAQAQELADRFAGRYPGKMAELDAAGLAEAMRRLEQVYELLSRAGSSAPLEFPTNAQDPKTGDLL